MHRNTILTAAITTIVLAAGVLLGALVFAPGPESVAPEPAPVLLEASAENVPAEPTLLGPDALDSAEIRKRLDDLAKTVAALQEEQARARKEHDPHREMLEEIGRLWHQKKEARASANQVAAVATLRNLTSAQAQIQATGRVDTDNDGTGEFAGFLEMSGAAAGRMSRTLVPPVLSSAFRMLNAQGEAKRSGYLFRFYLPARGGSGVGEPAEGFRDDGLVDSDLAETTWCCYAWPAEAGSTGTRTYVMNQSGDTLFTEDARYTGEGGGPKPDAAFLGRGITGRLAHDAKGNDGNVWKRPQRR